MPLRGKAMKRIGLLLGTVALATVTLFNGASAATVLFKDTFKSFKLGKRWDAPAFLSTNNVFHTYLGAPNVILAKTANGLRMTSAEANYQTTGIATVDAFSLTTGHVGIEFQTGDFIDSSLTLPQGTTDKNIDGVIALELLNPTTGDYFVAELFGADYGTDTQFGVSSSLAPGTWYTGKTGWQYDESYQIVFDSTASATVVKFEDSLGHVLFRHKLPAGLGYLGQFYIVLPQWMGTPGSSYVNDVFVHQVEAVQD